MAQDKHKKKTEKNLRLLIKAAKKEKISKKTQLALGEFVLAAVRQDMETCFIGLPVQLRDALRALCDPASTLPLELEDAIKAYANKYPAVAGENKDYAARYVRGFVLRLLTEAMKQAETEDQETALADFAISYAGNTRDKAEIEENFVARLPKDIWRNRVRQVCFQEWARAALQITVSEFMADTLSPGMAKNALPWVMQGYFTPGELTAEAKKLQFKFKAENKANMDELMRLNGALEKMENHLRGELTKYNSYDRHGALGIFTMLVQKNQPVDRNVSNFLLRIAKGEDIPTATLCYGVAAMAEKLDGMTPVHKAFEEADRAPDESGRRLPFGILLQLACAKAACDIFGDEKLRQGSALGILTQNLYVLAGAGVMEEFVQNQGRDKDAAKLSAHVASQVRETIKRLPQSMRPYMHAAAIEDWKKFVLAHSQAQGETEDFVNPQLRHYAMLIAQDILSFEDLQRAAQETVKPALPPRVSILLQALKNMRAGENQN